MSDKGCPGPNGLNPKEWGCDETQCDDEFREKCWALLISKGYEPKLVRGSNDT